MANFKIELPANLTPAMMNFMTDVRRFNTHTQTINQKIAGIQSNVQQMQPAMSSFSGRVNVLSNLMTKLERQFRAALERIVGDLGSATRGMFSRLFGSMIELPIGAINLLTGALTTVELVVYSAKFAKWIWDRMVSLGDSMLQDFVEATGLGTTVGGLRAYRITIGQWLPEDPTAISSAVEAHGNIVSSQASVMRMLGTFNISDNANRLVATTIAVAKWLRTQPQGLELATGQMGNFFGGPTLLAALTMSDEELAALEEKYNEIRKALELSDDAVKGWSDFSISVKAMWVKIDSIVGENLASSGFVRAVTDLTDAFVHVVQVTINKFMTPKVMKAIEEEIDNFAKFLKGEKTENELTKITNLIPQVITSIVKAEGVLITLAHTLYDLYNSRIMTLYRIIFKFIVTRQPVDPRDLKDLIFPPNFPAVPEPPTYTPPTPRPIPTPTPTPTPTPPAPPTITRPPPRPPTIFTQPYPGGPVTPITPGGPAPGPRPWPPSGAQPFPGAPGVPRVPGVPPVYPRAPGVPTTPIVPRPDIAPTGRPTRGSSAEVDTAISEAANAHGISENTLRSIASIESGFNPTSNWDRRTQYKGLYQIGHEEWRQYGHGNIYNARDNANAAAAMLADHKTWFTKRYGREPTDAELYMMHQQGRGFFTRGTLTNPWGNVGRDFTGPMTRENFFRYWETKLARRKATVGGDVAIHTTTAPGTSVPTSPTSPTTTPPIPPTPTVPTSPPGKWQDLPTYSGARNFAPETVDPRLREILWHAKGDFEAAHPGYTIEGVSGRRPVGAGAGPHWSKTGAIDMIIVGPNGKAISNEGDDPTGLYHEYARHAYGEVGARYPELKDQFAWGGAFGTQKGGGGPPDLMHFDLSGARGHISTNRLEYLGPMPGVKYGLASPDPAISPVGPITEPTPPPGIPYVPGHPFLGARTEDSPAAKIIPKVQEYIPKGFDSSIEEHVPIYTTGDKSNNSTSIVLKDLPPISEYGAELAHGRIKATRIEDEGITTGGTWKKGDIGIVEQTRKHGYAQYWGKEPSIYADPRMYGSEEQEWKNQFQNTVRHELGHVGAMNLRDEVIPGTDQTIKQKYDKFQQKTPFKAGTDYPEDFDELRQRMADLKRENDGMDNPDLKEGRFLRLYEARYWTKELSERIGKRVGMEPDDVKAKAEEYKQDLENIIKKKRAEHSDPSSLKTQGKEKLPNSPKQINAENSKNPTHIENKSDQDIIPVEDNNAAALQ